MRKALSNLDDALRRADPELHGRLRDGAPARELDDAERALGRPLPADLRRLYAWRDGQTGKGTFPAHGQGVAMGFFLSLARALERRETLRARDGSSTEGWRESWLPVIDGGQGDLLCVDLDDGRVLEFQHETPRRPVLFASVQAWIEKVTAGLVATPSGAAAASSVDACVAAYLENPELARDWPELRQWIDGLKTCGSPAVFARLALAVEERPRDQLHPVMRDLVDAVERWLADPSESARDDVRTTLEARNRQFVPRQEVSFAVQHAADAVVSGDLDRARDGALHAVAEAAPGLVDGKAPDTERRCRELHERLRDALAG